MSRIHRVHGAVPVPRNQDKALLLTHVRANLLRRGCPTRLAADDVLLIDGRSERRGSVFGFIDGGWIRLEHHRQACVLAYEFSTLGGLQLCAGLSLVAGSLGWFAVGSVGLAAFGLLAPLLWLYGANRVMTAIRVPDLLARLCASAPGTEGAGAMQARAS